jgi:hypothetical protein
VILAPNAAPGQSSERYPIPRQNTRFARCDPDSNRTLKAAMLAQTALKLRGK